MPFDYIRGIMLPTGGINVEYQLNDSEEPGQVLIEQDLSAKEDAEIIVLIREKSEVFNDPDFTNITINRDWFEHVINQR